MRLYYVLFVMIVCVFTACDSQGKSLVKEGVASDETVAVSATQTIEIQTETTVQIRDVYVQIGGAVNSPGVYKVSSDKRVFEAIELAGGLRADADRNRVNLVSPVVDEMQIYVPEIGEVSTQQTLEQQTQSDSSSGKININTAQAEDLTRLPGIGESRARTIIQYREEHGGFQNISEIMNISGIKQAMFDKIKDLITI